MTTTSTPARVHAFSPFNFAAGVAALALIFTAFTAIDFDLLEIIKGGPRLARLLGQMWPLNTEALPRLLDSLWITFLAARRSVSSSLFPWSYSRPATSRPIPWSGLSFAASSRSAVRCRT